MAAFLNEKADLAEAAGRESSHDRRVANHDRRHVEAVPKTGEEVAA